jgi:hypothetical protein
MSQEATARDKSHLKMLRKDAAQKPNTPLHHMELVDSAPEQPALTADAVKKTAQELHEAIHHRNMYGYGFSSPDVDKLVNLLETLSAADRKAVEAAYNQADKPNTLRQELAQSLGKDSPEFSRVEGLLNRQDGKADYASQIHTELAALAQIQQREEMQGASRYGAAAPASDERKNAEADIRKTIAGLDAKQLDELKKNYAQNYPGHDLTKDLMENPNVSQATKESLPILLKGREQRSDADCVALANIGIKHQRFDVFQEACSAASPAARKTLQNSGCDHQIDSAFSGAEQTRAHDLLACGHDSLLNLIDGNNHFYHTNRDGITQAVENAAPDEKAQFIKGEQIAKACHNDDNKTQHLSQDEKNALSYYQRVQQMLSSAGSAREVAVWEAKLAGQGDFTTRLAATHDDGWAFVHWFSGHDKNELMSQVENLSQQDWQRFRAHPEEMDRVDQSLKTYASDAERKEIMDMLRAKVNVNDKNWTYEQAQKAGNRAVDEKFRDCGKNTSAKLDAIFNMSDKERQAYRNNENGFRDRTDKMVREQLPEGVQRDLATRLLKQYQTGRGADAVDKVMLDAAKNDGGSAIADIERAYQQDPSLVARLKNPQTSDDKAIKSAFLNAGHSAVDKAGWGDQTVAVGEGAVSTVPGQYDKFLKPLFQTGHLPLELKLSLQQSDKQAQMEELLHAGAAEQKRVLALKDGDVRGTVLEDQKQRQILENTIKQNGRPDGADLFRSYVTGSDSYCGRLEEMLQKMSPQERQDLANEYFTKYNSLISNDVISKAPETEKFRFRELLQPTDVDVRQVALDARTEYNRHSSAMDDFIASHWDYSKIQAQNRADELDKFITTHAPELDKLNPQQKQQFMDAVKKYQSAEQDYITSKGKISDALIDSTITLAAVAGSVFTGGVSLELCALIGIGGAAYRVGASQAIEGSDFDQSPENYLRQCFKGFTAASLGFLPGGQGLVTVGERLAPEILEQGLAQAGMHKLPEATADLLEQQLARVTRQEALAGGKNLSTKVSAAVEKSLGDSASNEEKQLLEQSLQRQLKKQVTDDIKSSLPKRVLNAAEPVGVNAAVGAGSNAATEIAATAIGLEDPDTLWERVKSGAVSGAAGALVFHFGFKAAGATYSGLKGVIGRDWQGLFAGEGSTIRHEDGTYEQVGEGKLYRFRTGDQVVEEELAGTESFRPNQPFHLKLEGYDITVRPGHEQPIGRAIQPRIQNELVSRVHLIAGVDQRGPYITDQSSNGTFVTRNGNAYKLTKGQPFYLEPGDRISLSRPIKDGGVPVDVSQPEERVAPQRLEAEREGDVLRARGEIPQGALRQSNEYGYYHEIPEKIQDGFSNAGADADFLSDGRFLPDHRPATVVDLANDPVLRDVIADAHKYFDKMPPRQRAEELTKWARQLLTPDNWSGAALDGWYDSFNRSHPGERIMLGEFIRQGKGVCSQQALLLKVLADQFPDMHCTLVRGNMGGGDNLNHAWTTFDFGDGNQYIYDPRNKIFGKEARSAQPYMRSGSAIEGRSRESDAGDANREVGGLKPGQVVQYQGNPWRVAGFEGDKVILTAGAQKQESAIEVQKLNPGRQFVVGQTYRLERSNHTIEDGWILKGKDTDGYLVFAKKDSMKAVVSRSAFGGR